MVFTKQSNNTNCCKANCSTRLNTTYANFLQFFKRGKRRYRKKMDGSRPFYERSLYMRATPDPYYHLYGTVRGNPTGKIRSGLDIEPSKSNKKSFNFLPWKKNRSKTDDFLQSEATNLGKHNKYKFGSVSALSSTSLYKDWDSSLPYTTSFSASDLVHASVRSVQPNLRGTIAYPWENYHDPTTLSLNKNATTTDILSDPQGEKNENTKRTDVNKFKPCTCEKKKSGPFGTLNFRSLKSSKCNCGFSSVRSSNGSFAPPPPPRRKSILPNKVNLYALQEDQISQDEESRYTKNNHNIYDTLSKRNKYKAPEIPTLKMKSQPSASQSRFFRSLDKSGKNDAFNSVSSRKSILECDVTAYDLVTSYLKSTDNVDSDLDDDLSDNVIEDKESLKIRPGTKYSNNKIESSSSNNKLTSRSSGNADNSPSPVSSESESGIYSQPPSIRIGGHGMKVNNPVSNGGGSQTPSLYSEGSKTNSVDSRNSSWSNSSTSDDGIYSLPEPDYDKDDYDSLLKYNNKINSSYNNSPSSVKKYASGDCLASSDCKMPSYKQYSTEAHNSPHFSTIRKASSLVTLAPRAERTGLRSDYGRIPAIPEPPRVPTSCVSPIPPPPPPPPPPPLPLSSSSTNTQLSKSSRSDESESDTSSVSEYSKASTIKANQSHPTSSVAAELAEKFKGNQPLLRKNPVEVKVSPKVNAVNPYADIKSILKKTVTDSSSNNSRSGESNSSPSLQESLVFQEIQDIKKKKRVQFKSLSDESLAIEHIQHQPLSSSDEELDETNQCSKKETNTSSSTSTTRSSSSNLSEDNKLQSTKDNDDGFKTVEEFLSDKPKSKTISVTHLPRVPLKLNSQKLPTKTDSSVSKKSEYRVPLRTNLLSRPSQPPPPPPSRKTGGPPPRPLNSAPKSYSHCDLRVTSSKPGERYKKQSSVKTSIPVVTTSKPHLVTSSVFQNRNRPRSTNTTHLTSTLTGTQNKNETLTGSKNGVSSPAASLEATTTSMRGKSTAKNGDDCQSKYEGSTRKKCLTKTKTHQETTSLKSVNESMDDDTKWDDESQRDTKEYDNESNNEPKKSDKNNHLNSVSKEKQENQGSIISCRILSPPPLPARCETTVLTTKVIHSTVAEDQSKETDTSSIDEIGSPSEIEGPLYSNLLYVPMRNSPPPPPLPMSPPPLKIPPPPPQRDIATVLTNSSVKTIDNIDTIYDKPNYSSRWNFHPILGLVPFRLKGTDKNSDIYESRRCSDTGATIVTISNGVDPDSSEHIYASLNSESIYEELPGQTLANFGFPEINPFGKHRGSFFEGASKAEILKYLEGAKERVVHHMVEEEDGENLLLDDYEDEIPQTKHRCIQNLRNNPIRISNISSSSESSTLSSNSNASRESQTSDELTKAKIHRPPGSVEIERADSGVGTETSRPHWNKRITKNEQEKGDEEILCADCDQQIDIKETGVTEDQCCPLVCVKCGKKRSERKEIVTEIVETEFKYGKDLMIIKEEFYTPMEVAALLTKEQLNGIFLNLSELILVNRQFAEKLKDGIDIAVEQGDEDYTTVNIGKLFLETSTMLQAFEVYCIQQGSASVLLSNLEKEKELLRIFLKVSQMENTLLRRMNLSAFLMVPVQRVTKYPLLLNRLYKVTPYHHQDREALREAQLKIELHLEHINQQTKGVTGTKIWRRLSNLSTLSRRIISISDIGSIQFRKMAMEILGWSKEEIGFVMAGKLAFGLSSDFTRSRRGTKALKFASCHALMATLGKPNSNYRPDLIHDGNILFPRNTGIRDATLLLMKEKSGKYSLAREPLHLGSCVISSELEDDDVIELQEYTTKESLYLKAECKTEALDWLKQLRYHAKDLGTWRRRRNALANIMINGMVRQ